MRDWWRTNKHLVAAWVWVFPGIPVAWYVTYVMPEPHALFAIILISLWANFYTGIGAHDAQRAEQMADPNQPNP